jgi:hypothetical protein
VHVSPDCQPETLRALGEMIRLLIKQIDGQSNTGLHADGAVRCVNCNSQSCSMKAIRSSK